MEAKGSEEEAKDAKEEEPPSKVVIDLLNFAMKVVHEEMSGFFETHCVLWDYKEEDLKKITAGEGETLEQHAVFTQYLEQINERLDGFARTAGYADAQGVLTDVQKAVDHDKKLRDQMMKEMNALFAQMRLGLEQRDKAAAGAKGTEDDAKGDDDSTASAKTVEVDESEAKESKAVPKKKKPTGNGLMLFSQPIGLEYLLESVMNLAEYETFRMMMIMKARCDLGVPQRCGAFTPSTRLVSVRRGRGWFHFRVWGRSDRVERQRCSSVSGAPDNSSRSPFSAKTRTCWLRRAARNRHGPRHRAGVPSTAWRAADDAATAAAEGAAARGVPRRTNAVGATSGVPRPRPADAHHPTPPFSNFHPSRAAPGPDAVRTASSAKKKRPTTS
mmetsp:Transcript_18358/g.54692  ORF Transcript_18358/g.54692 Transcript_18358/m.54692 type:complete len:386 (+) Transcript_18358:195-1352(+)